MNNTYQTTISCHPKNAATVANSMALLCIKIGLESYSVSETPRRWWSSRRRFVIKAEDANGDKVSTLIKAMDVLCGATP